MTRIRNWLRKHIRILSLKPTNGQASIGEINEQLDAIKESKRQIKKSAEKIVIETQEVKSRVANISNT